MRQLRAADLTRAIDLGLRVATDSEEVLGADHPDTLASRHGLAGAYRSVGRFGEAIARSSGPSPTSSGCWAPTTPTP